MKFPGAGAAEEAFESALLGAHSLVSWLNDVSVVSRSRFGLMTIAPSRSEHDLDLFECDDADVPDLAASDMDVHTRFLVGPFASPSWYATAADADPAEGRQADRQAAAVGEADGDAADGDAADDDELDPLELGKELLHRGALKDLLPPDSSALLLVADAETCSAMIELFAARHPNIVCRDLGTLLRPRLAG